ncbi:MAG: HAMP domain-containing protein [Candidatus Riflebacteria bacterium]|nr:HAMP domain-containing protein [Candidatus Riflebacteria bacterium]
MKGSYNNKYYYDLIFIFLLFVGFSACFFQNRLNEFVQKSRSDYELSDARNLQPVLRDRTEPLVLCRERLLTCFNNIFRNPETVVSSITFKAFVRELEAEMPSDFRAIAFKPDFQYAGARNFPSKYLRLIYSLNAEWIKLEKKTLLSGKIQEFSKILFGEGMYSRLANRVSLSYAEFCGKPGIVLIARIFPPNDSSEIEKEYFSKFQELPKRFGYRGTVFVFVPSLSFSDPKWIAKASAKPMPNLRQRQSSTQNGSSDSGLLNYIITFSSIIPILMAAHFFSRKYLFRNRGLATKFLVYAFMAIIIPAVALVQVFSSKTSIENFVQDFEKNDRLDKKLDVIEKNEYLLDSKILGNINVFLEKLQKYPWVDFFLKKYVTQKGTLQGRKVTYKLYEAGEINDLFQPLYKNSLSTFLMYEPKLGSQIISSMGQDDSFRIISTDDLDDSEKLSQAMLMLQKSAYNLPEPENKKASLAADAFQTFIESLFLSIGRKKMYEYLLEQNSMKIYKILDKQIYLYRHLGFDKNSRPSYVFFFGFTPHWIKKKTIISLSEEKIHSKSGFSDYAFCEKSSIENYNIFPERGSVEPGLLNLFHRMAEEEKGYLRAKLTIGGVNYNTISRYIPNLGHSAMVLEADNEKLKTRTSRLYAFSPALYPLLVILMMWLFFKDFYLKPLHETQRGINRIKAGDYKAFIQVQTDDEIGRLCSSFNHMAEGLQQKEYLSRFLSELTVEAIKTNDKPPVTRLKGAVMFSDIRGFTTMSEKLPPEEIVDMLNNHFTRMEEVIKSHDGTIEKFIGDAIMALFLPVHGKPNPAERACQAGLAMVNALSKLNRERESAGQFTIKTGVGISYGDITMGILGESSERHDFTVVGPTVSDAAQMEKYSKRAFETFVVVDEKTRQEIANRFIFQKIYSENNNSIWEVIKPVDGRN